MCLSHLLLLGLGDPALSSPFGLAFNSAFESTVSKLFCFRTVMMAVCLFVILRNIINVMQLIGQAITQLANGASSSATDCHIDYTSDIHFSASTALSSGLSDHTS